MDCRYMRLVNFEFQIVSVLFGIKAVSVALPLLSVGVLHFTRGVRLSTKKKNFKHNKHKHDAMVSRSDVIGSFKIRITFRYSKIHVIG